MADPSVYFVGSPSEVGHHAAPLQTRRQVLCLPPAQVVQRASAGDLAVFTMEHFDRFRDACLELKKRNVATLYLIDGILEWRNAWENREDEPACPWTMRPVLAHKVACIGESQARVLETWGNAPKIEIVGIPRLDKLGTNSNRSKRRSGNGEPSFRLLIMTAKWPGFTDRQLENAAQSLGDLRDWFAANPLTNDGRPIEIVWRLTQGMHERIGVQNHLADLTGVDLASELDNVDAVISTPSTAMLEAMMSGVPVAALEYNNTPQYVGTAWQITSPEHIAGVVSELTHPSPEKLLFQRSVLEDAIKCDGKATQRLQTLIDRMLEIAARNIGTGQPLRFPEPILLGTEDDSSSVPIRIGHATVFAKFAEFQEDNTLELQAQLAHSRREIKHLQLELGQLKSELEEAHGIFAQINQHPIAGPLVKVRQKLIDWIERFTTRNKTRNRTHNSQAQMAPAESDSTPSEPLNPN